MKVSILPENITKYLPLINKVLPAHSQVPILSNILLEAMSDGFFLQATDLEIGTRIKIPAKIEEEGAITVPGKELLETINSLPKDKILISTNKDRIEVEGRTNKIIFNTIASAEFPQIYKEKGEMVIKMSGVEFENIFSNLTFSVSQEESRPQLTGVYIDARDSGINFVSTDGYRMSMKHVEGLKTKNNEGLIVSVKLINELMGLKGEKEILLFINKPESQVLFEAGDVILVGRIIGGEFPAYEKVIPKSFETTVIIDREELLQGVRLVSIFAKDNSNIASLRTEKGSVVLKTEAQGIGEGETVVECQKKGEDMKIAFNIKYLMDILKSVKGKLITIKLNSPAEPAVFELADENFTHVIMPIQTDS